MNRFFKRWLPALIILSIAAEAFASTYTLAPPLIPNDVVRIRSVATNRCLEMDVTAPYLARFTTCSDAANMRFYNDTDASGQWHNFRNLATNLCMTDNGTPQNYLAFASGGACSLTNPVTQDKMVFLNDPGVPSYFIEAAPFGPQSWGCLGETTTNGFYANGNPASYASGCYDGWGISDNFYVEHVDTYRLRNVSTSQCVYPGGNGNAAGTWGCWKDPNMAVRFESLGGNDYRIRLVSSGQCLYGNPVQGGAVASWQCWSDPNMVWTKQDLGNNQFRLQHKNTGNCMYTRPGNGSTVNNFACWNDPAMVWTADPF